MRPFDAFDTETGLIADGLAAPPMACLSWARPGASGLEHVTEAGPFVNRMLDGDELIVGHHAAYDLGVVANTYPGVLPKVFGALDANRVTDTMLRQQLIDLAKGEFRGRTDGATGVRTVHTYSLGALTERKLGRKLNKGPDSWRTRYGELIPIPLTWWPEEAKAYALDDAEATRDVVLAQEADEPLLADQFRQTRAAFALHLVAAWGIATDPEKVARLEARVQQEIADLEGRLVEEGLVRGDGTRDTKKAKARMEAAMAAQGRGLKLTEKGGICLDADACAESGDPLLEAYARRSALGTILSKDVPALRRGVIHPDFQVLMETGRTSATGYNSQNVAREGGIRECFVPRAGKVFVCADYDGMELRTFAQVCIKLLGRSELAKVLNAGQDPHLGLAAELLGISYQEAVDRYKAGDPVVKQARQFAKAGNFGFPGGLGQDRFIGYAKENYGLRLSRDQGILIKDAWFRRYPEARPYFQRITAALDNGESIQQLFSGRVRGLVGFTEAANGMFQGLGADMTKAALYEVVKACYTGSSPLRGCRVVNYIHDEFILEAPEERAHEAALELQRVMVEAARPWLPDVPATATPLLARCWSKDAKALKGPDGRLVPWDEPTT